MWRAPSIATARRCRGIQVFPEFQEYFVHYPLKQSQGSSHDYVTAHGRARARPCSTSAAAKASSRADSKKPATASPASTPPNPPKTHVIRGLLQRRSRQRHRPGRRAALNGKRFSRVLLLDVLEHLRRPGDDPRSVPRACSSPMAPDRLRAEHRQHHRAAAAAARAVQLHRTRNSG